MHLFYNPLVAGAVSQQRKVLCREQDLRAAPFFVLQEQK